MRKATASTRLKISNAALSLFIKKGICGTTTKDIASRARVSEGTIYNYFESKDDLAYKLFTHYMDKFREELAASFSESAAPEEKLERLVGAFFKFAEREPKAYTYIMVAHYTELRKMPRIKKKPMDIFVEVIEEGMRKGVFDAAEKNLGAAHVIGIVTRTILFYKNGLLESSPERIIDDTVKSALRVLES